MKPQAKHLYLNDLGTTTCDQGVSDGIFMCPKVAKTFGQ
ncbi:MAG: hypothetical protein A4E59_01355 [Syntrophorhabdus sp. PtaB.Bin027]|nr:MAG: hypothetical protein A4E59_01355 [Syntrophorhabdus sp. PtaB.Bin027]